MTQSLEEWTSVFSKWFRKNAARLRHAPSGDVADEIGARVIKLSQQLGVEIGDAEDEAREVIVTAFSDPSLFPVVRRICEAVKDVATWKFVALKPPRGFEFRISLGATRVDARAFRFEPLSDVECGIRLVPPSDVRPDLPEEPDCEELGWLLVETGIGEELAGKLQHVEIGPSQEGVSSRPIDQLARYVRENCGLDTTDQQSIQ